MGRWLTATILLASALGSGVVAFLNGGDPQQIHLTPSRSIALPLGTALALAFATGALLVALVATGGAVGRAWRRWRGAERRARVAATLARTRTRAETLLVAGDADAARNRLADAMTTHGPDERLLELLAGASEQSGDIAGAIAVVEDARARRPESPLLARRLRDLYVAAERADVERQPDTAALRFEAALADPEPARSLRRLQALAREHPGFTAAWVVAGDRLLESGHAFRARRTWEHGARVEPATVLVARLSAPGPDGAHPERPTRALSRLRRRHPADPRVVAGLVRHHLRHGALDAADQALASWPPEVPGTPGLDALRGECARRRGRYEDAADHLARAAAVVIEPDLGRCRACGHGHAAWTARCTACGRWGTCGT